MSSAPSPLGDWRPKAVVFDLLTGLLNSWTLWDASTPSGSSSEGRIWRQRYLDITFNLPHGGAYVPYADCVRQSAQDVGLPASAAEALLANWATGLKAWPETGQTLLDLRARGYRLGVVTNCSEELGRAAVRVAESATGQEFSFDRAITAEESGFYKPARKAYQAILDRLDLPPDEVLFVAGSAGDVQGATEAGMRVVWHNKIGLPKKGTAVALREGKTLDETLQDLLG